MAKLPEGDVDTLRWRVLLLNDDISRVRVPKLPRHDVIIYTDAATSARIVASLAIDVPAFEVSKEFRILRAETSDPHWGYVYFDDVYLLPRDVGHPIANFRRGGFSQGADVTFYIDNSNCRDALVRGYTATKAINRMVKLFWPQVEKLSLPGWLK